VARAWVPFRLWPAQADVLDRIERSRLVVLLKARQLGLTYLVLALALWAMLFRPAATVMLFSRRDDEATDLLATRLRGMYTRLPPWLRARSVTVDNDHELELSNGSRALAFPTTAGDSYSASLVIVDEADLVPDLDRLLRAVKPTIDAGGRLILVGRTDKSRPQSPFKRIFQAATEGNTEWTPIFLPWHARPDRTPEWYEAQRADVLARTGALDALHENYPATAAEALAPRSLDKRIPAEWLTQCYRPMAPLVGDGLPALPGLVVYARPIPGRRYSVGGDTAEGNPTSDDSAAVVLDRETGEEAASLTGKLQPAVFAHHLDRLGRWYNCAPLMIERNNHGHAVLLWLREHSRLVRLCGHDGNEGWLSSTKGKALLYDHAAEALRGRRAILHSAALFEQLASIEGSSLRAPEGEMDDRADAYALAVAAGRVRRRLGQPTGAPRREAFYGAPGIKAPPGPGGGPWLTDLGG
jgi:hypothetical protein